jgi:diguanylate cyclase
MAGEQIARDLSQVMAILKTVSVKNAEYGRTLESAAGSLDSLIDPAQFRDIVSGLAAATLDMASHNRSLSEQLQRSSREIDSLRADLESVRVESLTDGLTGLANRRMFDETIRLRIAEARNTRTDLCLVIGDIDHFKRFNDNWGHHTGDQVLRFVATVMSNVARPDHTVARFGGEEFVILMPRTALDAASGAAESIRRTIQAKRLRRRSTDEDLGQVTVSFGVSCLKPGDTPQTFIERADACLYASKREGRNRVTVENAPAHFVA